MATRTYDKDDLTVFWDSSRCIHTGICLRSLHSVFNLKNRPWVNVDGADAEHDRSRPRRSDDPLAVHRAALASAVSSAASRRAVSAWMLLASSPTAAGASRVLSASSDSSMVSVE